MNFGTAIKKIRVESGMSQRELAEALKMTIAGVWKIENGRTIPKHMTIEKICSVLHVPLAYLYNKSFGKEDYICK